MDAGVQLQVGDVSLCSYGDLFRESPDPHIELVIFEWKHAGDVRVVFPGEKTG